MNIDVEHGDRQVVEGPAAAGLELLLIFLIFFLYAGWLPPDVNEAHYLAKAKHFWNPHWCAGDHFLESADAHWVFFWTFGWLTLFFPLSWVAWLGRLVTWVLLAAAWRRLSKTVVPAQGFAVLAAGLLVCFWSRAAMAGEWVVGGVEAKGFAYVLVLLGICELTRQRWGPAWLLLGGAAALHVLVGGWSVVASGIAWILLGRDQRPTLRSMLPWLAGALVIALAGLLPVVLLNRTTDSNLVRQANQIYVFQRLAHHLVFHQFPPYLIARQGVLLAAWGIFMWQFARGSQPYKRLCAFVSGAVLISVVGILVDFSTLLDPAWGAELLRFYWFRLSDAILPIGVVCGVGVWLQRWRPSRPVVVQWGIVGALLVSAVSLGDHVAGRRVDRRPRADVQGRLTSTIDNTDTQAAYADWLDVCAWVESFTPAHACFLTPTNQQTFKWYAGRSEVVNSKDVPQDAVGVCQWWQRRQEVEALMSTSSGAAEKRDQLLALAKRFNFQYVVAVHSSASSELGLPLIYGNSSFGVYQLESVSRTSKTH